MGHKCHRAIVDDPHTLDGIRSKTKRQASLDFFTQTLPARLKKDDNSAIIVVMQRLHQEDISGHILANETGWEHLMLPNGIR